MSGVAGDGVAGSGVAGSGVAGSGVAGAVAALAAGRAVVVIDDEDRENEGDLVFAAEHATPELMAFLVRHSSGLVCVAMPDEIADRLALPAMWADNQDRRRTAYTVSVDAVGPGTGASARDRAHTARLLADPATEPSALSRPGHVLGLRARPGGVLERGGHTEAAVDLARLAGCAPVGVLCEIVSELDATGMARGPELRRFADTHDLPLITVAELAAYRLRCEALVTRAAQSRLPLAGGAFQAFGFRGTRDGAEHVALVLGDPARLRSATAVPVEVHAECVLGDVFGSARCGCAGALAAGVAGVSSAGSGVVLYLRRPVARVNGLLSRLCAYEDNRADSCGPLTPTEVAIAAQMLHDLGLARVRPARPGDGRLGALTGHGIAVGPLWPIGTAHDDSLAG